MLKKVLTAGTASVAIVLGAAGANAADLMDTPVSSWTGAYGGVHAGYGWGKASDSLSCNTINQGHPGGAIELGSLSFFAGSGALTAFCNEDEGDGPLAISALANAPHPVPWYTYDDLSDIDGWLGGIQVGYLHQIGNFVLGVEVAGSVAGLSDNGTTELLFDGGPDIGQVEFLNTELGEFGGLYEGSLDVNWLVTAVGRLGFAVSDAMLLSANGGLAWVGTDFSSSAGYSDEKVAQGWTVGGQLDYRIGENTTVFASYGYHWFDDISYQGNSLAELIANFHEYDLDIHVVKVGLNYHWN